MSAVDANTPFDASVLVLATHGDSVLAQELIGIFFASARAQLRQLETETQVLAWRENLHRLKGAAQSIGALALAQTASLAEQSNLEEGMQNTWLKRLSDELDRLSNLLQK